MENLEIRPTQNSVLVKSGNLIIGTQPERNLANLDLVPGHDSKRSRDIEAVKLRLVSMVNIQTWQVSVAPSGQPQMVLRYRGAVKKYGASAGTSDVYGELTDRNRVNFSDTRPSDHLKRKHRTS